MSAIAPISVNDGKATPVAHVFTPVTTDGSTAKWSNRVASIPKGFETLEITVRAPVGASAAYRVIGSLTLPTVAAVDGQDTVVRSNKLDFAMNLSQMSTAQDRKDAVTLLKNLLADPTVVAAVMNVEPYY